MYVGDRTRAQIKTVQMKTVQMKTVQTKTMQMKHLQVPKSDSHGTCASPFLYSQPVSPLGELLLSEEASLIRHFLCFQQSEMSNNKEVLRVIRVQVRVYVEQFF